MANIKQYSYDITKASSSNVDITKLAQIQQSESQAKLSRVNFINLGASEVVKNINNSNKIDVNKISMCLDHHFKLSIEGLMVNGNMKNSSIGNFLPIYQMTFTPISVTHTGLNIGIFTDLPILSKRRMGELKVTLLDDNSNTYETAVVSWFQNTTYGGYVKPLSEIIKEANYIEYDGRGKQSKHYRFWVIPEGEVSVTRAYEGNNLKKVEFGMLIVGDIDQLHKNLVARYSERLVPTEGQQYEFVPTSGDSYINNFTKYGITKDGKATGIIFNSREDAEREAKKLNYSSDNYTTLNSTRVHEYGVADLTGPQIYPNLR